MPARFGGSALDYQIVEDEAPNGTARLMLRVAPSVGMIDDAAIRATLLHELGGHGGVVQQHMAALWRRAGTVTIVREAPLMTRSGKVLPFHPVRPRAD